MRVLYRKLDFNHVIQEVTLYERCAGSYSVKRVCRKLQCESCIGSRIVKALCRKLQCDSVVREVAFYERCTGIHEVTVQIVVQEVAV